MSAVQGQLIKNFTLFTSEYVDLAVGYNLTVNYQTFLHSGTDMYLEQPSYFPAVAGDWSWQYFSFGLEMLSAGELTLYVDLPLLVRWSGKVVIEPFKVIPYE